MARNLGRGLAMAAALLASAHVAMAQIGEDALKRAAAADIGFETGLKALPALKAANANTVASRATSSQSATVYGGFELATSAVVYILVRGNSLGTLGVTNNYLDAPRLRLYNSQGQDLVNDAGGRPGFNGCAGSNTTDAAVVSYYQNVRRQPTHSRDACIAITASAGAYTFSVTPSVPGVTSGSTTSVPGSGEILFEVTLGPQGAAPPADDNRSRTERLVGGTWTFTYTILSTFSNRYAFTSVAPSSAVPGDWVASGTDEFGNLVVGTYSSATGAWGVLDPGSVIDRFYVFTFSDLNRVAGCYYQISPPGTTNLGNCYSMSGSRFPLKSRAPAGDRLGQERLEAEEALGPAPEPDPAVLQAYLRARKQLAEEGAGPGPAAPAERPLDPAVEADSVPLRAGPKPAVSKSASTRTVAARATATANATVYGGFELSSSATVYILARGNSLGALGVTQGFLDLPRLRLYDSAGRDLAFDTSGMPGFNRCLTTGTASAPVRDYYSRIRGAPAHDNDACTSRSLAPGAYTFSVTPSIVGVTSPTQSVPASGEVLFEVTLGP